MHSKQSVHKYEVIKTHFVVLDHLLQNKTKNGKYVCKSLLALETSTNISLYRRPNSQITLHANLKALLYIYIVRYSTLTT